MIFGYAVSGGGGGKSGATLTVTAPIGSTVTISKGLESYTSTLVPAVFTGLSTGAWTIVYTDGTQSGQTIVDITADYSTTVAYFSATINVTYPSGSTCTVSKGSVTLTAPNTSGTWACVVPESGTWTVTATDGTDTATETVEITASGQSVSVELSYRLYLIKNRAPLVEFTTVHNATITNNVVRLTGETEATSVGGVGTTNKVNITGWRTLRGEISLTLLYPHNYVGIALDNRSYTNGDTIEYPNVASNKVTPVTTTFNELSIDLTSIASGSYTVSAIVKFYPNAYVENLWLE